MNSKSIHEKQFKTKLNGYSCVEVDQFMNEVADEIDCLNTSVEELKTKYAAAAAQLESYRDMDKILRDTLITAQKSANDMYEDARARAAQATSAAKEQAQKTLDDAAARAAAIIQEAKEYTGKLYSGEQRMRELIEDYKKQIRTVMSRQLDAMEEFFTEPRD